MSKKRYISWDVLKKNIVPGLATGYSVKISPNEHFSPISYELISYKPETPNSGQVYGNFEYSVDNGETWTAIPQNGLVLNVEHIVRVEISDGLVQQVFLTNALSINQVTSNASKVLETLEPIQASFLDSDIDKVRGNIYALNQDEQTIVLINTSSNNQAVQVENKIQLGKTSISALPDIDFVDFAIGVAVDGSRDTLWQINEETVYLRNLKGDIIKIFDLSFN